jgi:hypothetical protein
MHEFQLNSKYPALPPKTTITYNGNSYIVTKPCGRVIKCHNLVTAKFYKNTFRTIEERLLEMHSKS